MGEESGYNSDAAVSDPLDLNLKTEVDLEVYSAVLNTLDDPIDDNEQFIFDEESSRLLCIASNLEHIPSKIIDEYAHRTKILDLSGNQFHCLSSLSQFVQLEELILDDNRIDDDSRTSFPRLPNLHSLMINKNHLKNLFQLVDRLRHVYPQLEHLSLIGNEVCPYGIISNESTTSAATARSCPSTSGDEEYRRYRHLLIFRLPLLQFLDSRQISSNERHLATQLGDILYAIAERKQAMQ